MTASDETLRSTVGLDAEVPRKRTESDISAKYTGTAERDDAWTAGDGTRRAESLLTGAPPRAIMSFAGATRLRRSYQAC